MVKKKKKILTPDPYLITYPKETKKEKNVKTPARPEDFGCVVKLHRKKLN